MKGAAPVVFPAKILIDNREQIPYSFHGFRSDSTDGGGLLIVPVGQATIPSGDYSLEGMVDRVAVERKSKSDLFGTLGRGRQRFERELIRLNQLDFAAVVVEASWSVIIDVWPTELRQLAIWLADQSHGPNVADDERRKFAAWATAMDELLEGPPQRSKLNPKTVFRSVIAWQQRYPKIHWQFVPGRRCGELFTLRILERFYRDQQSKTEDK